MRKLTALLVPCLCFQVAQGQLGNDSLRLETFKRTHAYSDAHSHTGYKKYFRPRTKQVMEDMLRAKKYNDDTTVVTFDTSISKHYRLENWKPYNTKAESLRKGEVATIKQYDQNSYAEIKYVPGSILINSFSPYEKQFALKFLKNFISSVAVSGMGMRRLNAYGKNAHTPLNDFLAEYYFNLMQEEEQPVRTQSPRFIYKQDGPGYLDNPVYYSKIRMMRDAKELDSVLRLNDAAITNWRSFADTPHLITPMVMSVEGAQVLYGKLSGSRKNILNPLNIHRSSYKPNQDAQDAEYKKIKDELLSNVTLIKRLPHRMFCIILAHFAQNHVVGFAKSLDRDPESISHRAMATLTTSSSIRNDMIRKTYDGFNPGCEPSLNSCTPDTFGLKVVRRFLDATDNRYGKPTYIDVKHMDIKARIEYYYFRREYECVQKVPIPIIASHFAVSGEKQALAVATGLRPNFDRYEETTDLLDYYNKHIFRGNRSCNNKNYWENFMRGICYDWLNGKPQVLDAFERAMYQPLNFLDSRIFDTTKSTVDPFRNFIPDTSKIGWYYPWSINLFDEEIVEINKSDGFIGIMMDPRQLGAYMKKNKEAMENLKDSFRVITDTISNSTLEKYGLIRKDLDSIDYFKTEPFIRNIFYIVQTIKKQQAAEDYYDAVDCNLDKTLQRFPDFIRDSTRCKKGAWFTIGVGGDFDGFIDPIDFCPTAAYIPILHRRMILYCYIFAQLHKNEFREEGTGEAYIRSYEDSELKMHWFFYRNLREFIVKYF